MTFSGLTHSLSLSLSVSHCLSLSLCLCVCVCVCLSEPCLVLWLVCPQHRHSKDYPACLRALEVGSDEVLKLLWCHCLHYNSLHFSVLCCCWLFVCLFVFSWCQWALQQTLLLPQRPQQWPLLTRFRPMAEQQLWPQQVRVELTELRPNHKCFWPPT